MIKAPNVVYSTTPNATMVFANFMFKTGLIKTRPANVEGVFLPGSAQPARHMSLGRQTR